MKNLKSRKSLAVSLVMALLLSMVVLQGSFASEYLVAGETVLSPFTGSISLDVNPSIELKIENGTVTQALAYNDDGQSLLADSQLSGLTAEEAVKAMTKALVEGGYLTPSDVTPYLVITVSGSGAQQEEAAQALQNAAKQVAEELGTEFEVKSTFVSDDVVAQAEALGLSTGRYLLMQYISKTEDITLEEAIAKYGAAKIGELMNQFEDAEDLFDGDGLLLTEEQRAALEAAFAQQKETITAAEKTFHDAFKTLKSTYREKVHSEIKAQQKGDAQALGDTLNQMKEQMLAEYQTVRQALDDAVAAARATFLEAVTAAGIPEEISGQFYTWHMNKELNTEGELNAFLKEFTYKAEGKEDGQGQETIDNQNQSIASEDENQGEDQNEGQKDNKKNGKAGDQDEDQNESLSEDQDEDQNESLSEDQDSDNQDIEDQDSDNQDEDQASDKAGKSSDQGNSGNQGKSGDKNQGDGKGKK